jgi:hypothetical protein
MPGVLWSLAKQGGWAGVVGLALGAPAVAQPPDDPIATSNRLAELLTAPGDQQIDAAVPWLTPAPVEPQPLPAGKALLARLRGPAATTVTTVAPAQVIWSAPGRRPPIISTMPTSDRPMLPCEPVIEQVAAVLEPIGPLPPPPPPPPMLARPGVDARSPEPLPPPPALDPVPVSPPPQSTVTATPDADPPTRQITTIRFVDVTPAPKPPADDAVITAVIRRGGESSGSATDLRAAVEKVCKGKAVEWQTEVADERQVRVTLTVRSAADWEGLYDRMQNLTELGAYGLIFQVRVQR